MIRFLIKRLLFRPNERPVIVLGNQKSGTSAVAQLLSEYARLSKTIDIPSLWPPHVDAILKGQETLAQAIGRDPKPFSAGLIKEPNLTFFIDELLDLMPMARYVFVARDPRDNIRSILNRLNLAGNLAALPAEAWDSLSPAWASVFDARLWRLGGHELYTDVLAGRWARAAELYFRHEARLTLVRYEDFKAAKAQTIAALAERLGLPQRADIEHLLDHPFQPPGDNTLDWLDFFGERNLRGIEAICAGLMGRLGYQSSS